MKSLLKIIFINVGLFVLLVSLVNILSVSATFLYKRLLEERDLWKEFPNHVGCTSSARMGHLGFQAKRQWEPMLIGLV